MRGFVCGVTYTLFLAKVRVTVDGGTNRWVDFVKEHIGPEEQLKAPDLVTGDFDSCTDESMSYVTRLNCRVSTKYRKHRSLYPNNRVDLLTFVLR